MAEGEDVGFALRGSASPVLIHGRGDIATIAAPMPILFRSPPSSAMAVRLEAPHGAVEPPACFQVRYFFRGGALRCLLQAVTVTPRSGTVDDLEARMLVEPTPALERRAFREVVNLRLPGRAVRCTRIPLGKPISITLVDISASGVCVQATGSFEVGDLLFVEAPPNPKVEGAELELVRADAASDRRYGGRFLDESQGAAMFDVVVAAVRSAHSAHRARPSSSGMRTREPRRRRPGGGLT